MPEAALHQLQDVARALHALEDEATLFARLNALSSATVQELLRRYQRVERRFSPVNLLRYEVLNQLEEGRPPLSPADVELIRQEIEERNVAFFEKYGARLTEGLATYSKNDPFRIWQKGGRLAYFKLFHSFFYRKKEAVLVWQALREIGEEIQQAFHLTDQRLHLVDFSGSHHFGASDCWLALFPPDKAGHTAAHQLFCRFNQSEIIAGLWSGSAIVQDRLELVGHFTSLDPAIAYLNTLVEPYREANQRPTPDTLAEPGPPAYRATPSTAPPQEELLQPDELVSEALAALHHKRNLILQGPPGVGKTFMAQRLAETLLGGRDAARLRTVQFHQSYAYDDFVQGYRPDGRGGFRLRNGPFYEFCLLAQRHPRQAFVFIIDEINRGNLSKIFGELLLLLEADKRTPAQAIPLTYSETPFFIPPNVYLIGTMNTADRSLALVDYALRRRFAFVEVQPEFGEKLVRLLKQRGLDESFSLRLARGIEALNETIRQDPTLSPAFQIGHSYFLQPDLAALTAWFQRVIKLEIGPLLREYWFDDPSKAAEEVARLLKLSA